MSLFSALQVASNSLSATQIGLQVVGQNIANANTPGYIREELALAPAPAQQLGSLQLGLGVQVEGIVQKIDTLLEQRLRNAKSDSAAADIQEQTFKQLESLMGELGDNGLGKSLTDFFGSINDILNQPESASVRNLTVLRGQTLATTLNRLGQRASEVRDDLNKQVDANVADVNRLAQTIADLNVRISRAEGGDPVRNTAVGLRDQRNLALGDLSKLIDINVQEQKNGSVAVYVGGDFLVFGDEVRKIELARSSQGDELRLVDNHAILHPSSGKLLGLLNSRDQIIGNYQSQLDQFAASLAAEFNKVYSGGQGLKGYQQITGTSAVSSADAPLDAAGLAFTPVNGSFQILVLDKRTQTTKTTTIQVDLNGLDQDSTLATIRDQINAVSGVSASINEEGYLSIRSAAADQDIAFNGDTSGLLAAIGINTFFTGSSATTIGINQTVADDPGTFAASRAGIATDSDNAVDLARFLDRPLESRNNNTILQLHDQIIADAGQKSAEASSVADALKVFENTLQGQSMSISGVNIDEETIKMLSYQRSFQASAKFLATINELLGVLIDL